MPPPSLDNPALSLILFDEAFVVYKVASNREIPSEILRIVTQSIGSKDLVSITRTSDEISIVCRRDKIPKIDADVPRWRCIKFTGPLDFGLAGILCDITMPLKQASISIFTISTWDTDYVLVPEAKAEDAVKVLKSDGWKFNENV